MATNIIQEPGWSVSVACSHPAAPDAGDPVRYGVLTGVALTDEGDGGNAATDTTVYFGPCVVEMSVKAINDSGNSAIVVGDTIYYDDDDTPPLSKKATGNAFFGFAMEAVGSGETDTIKILKPASPGLDVTVSDQQIKSVAVSVPAVSSAATASGLVSPLFVSTEDITVSAIYFLPATAQSGADTNSATLDVRNIGAAAAGTDVLTQFAQTAGNDFAAGVPADFGTTLDNEAVTAGDVLAWYRTKVGDGLASPAGVVVIEYTVDVSA